MTTLKTKPKLEASWLAVLAEEFDKPHMKGLRGFLLEEAEKNNIIYPATKDVFNAFWKTPFDKVKVVILGQDPYHGANQAHGLCFSVQRGVDKPPSLNNIFLELHQSLNVPIATHGCLDAWAEQGVFLLNTVLTVRADQPNSHAGKGWEIFTDKVIEVLNSKREGLVFLLWGAPARKKAFMIDKNKHLTLEAPHPSPLSAHRGFLGCGHFVKTNEYLQNRGESPIDWGIT